MRSNGTAETIAAGVGMDIGKTLALIYRTLLNMEIDLVCVVDSRDLFTAFTTHRQFIDRSISGDINVIHFAFKVRNIAKHALDFRKAESFRRRYQIW